MPLLDVDCIRPSTSHEHSYAQKQDREASKANPAQNWPQFIDGERYIEMVQHYPVPPHWQHHKVAIRENRSRGRD